MQKLKLRLSLIYIWALPIISVPILYGVKNETGWSIYVTAVVIHLILSFTCYRHLVTKAMLVAPIKFSGIIILMGALVTFIAATTFIGTDPIVVSQHIPEHNWTTLGFFLSSIISLLGFIYLHDIVSSGSSKKLAVIALSLLHFGTVLWAIHLAFRWTVMPSLISPMSNADQLPNWYEPINNWSTSLYVIFMSFSYIAFTIYSVALFKEQLISKPWALALSSFGILSTILFLIGTPFFGMPISTQIIPWLLAILFLKMNKMESAESVHT